MTLRRFPFFRQHDIMDCGAVSLRMIAKYHGKDYSEEMLRRHCHVTRNGVSMLGISEAAEYIGFRSLGVKLTISQLSDKECLPCILHWNQNHFVVCYDAKTDRKGHRRFYIADPASEKLCYREEELGRCWLSDTVRGESCGTALLLQPGPEFGRREEENKAEKYRLRFFFKYLYPYKPQLAKLVSLMLAGSALQLILPFLTQVMVDRGINGKDLGMITLILLAQLSLSIAQLSVGFIRGWIMMKMNTRIDIALISDFLSKLMSMPLRFFDSKKTGDLMQRIDDHTRIKSFLMGNSLSMVFSMVNFVVFAVILAYYNFLILALFIAGNALYVVWVVYFMKYRKRIDAKRFSQAAAERSKVIQLIQGMTDIKLNNCERQKRWEWEQMQQSLLRIGLKGLKVSQWQQSGSLFFSQTTNILISFVAAYCVVEDTMTIGMMMSLTYIIGQMSAPVAEFIRFLQVMQDAGMSLERLNEIHSQEDEDTGVENKIPAVAECQSIYVSDVTFSYDGSGRNKAIENVSLTIPANKVTAIVGKSGSGKTTLIKLLQGFYMPDKGFIRIGETDLKDINPHSWRNVTGSVMQDSFIFSDTIERNIAMGDSNIDHRRLALAARLANADSFISELPLGFNTMIGMEGNGLSQGQRQRILIARAIYKNPEYIFFDEATNSLDTTNESDIMKNLAEFYRGKTVVVAAHRLSTVRNADQIVVMDNGRIVELGTHSQLVENHGTYYCLVKSQLCIGD